MITLPEYHDYDEFKTRSVKLDEIRMLGIDPYPHHFIPTGTAQNLHDTYKNEPIGHSEDAMQEKTPDFFLAGRLILFRAMGKNAFAHIQDYTGRIQILFNRDLTKVVGLKEDAEITSMKFIEKKLDLGDIIGIKGFLFRTQKGELTLFAKHVVLLCKSLLPLPDKHSGLVDKGLRYRKRWLDLITHPEVVETFKKRTQIIKSIRQYFDQANFLEVETPAIQNNYGGATASPFTTHLNALDQNMFLRISLEIPLKKLIVGGHHRIYEITKVFRNEGIDKTHNPEFTELEAYAAYWDYNDMMTFTENLFAFVAEKLYGTTKIGTRKDKLGNEHDIDLKTPWKRMSMKESLKTYAHIDIDSLNEAKMRALLMEKSEKPHDEINNANFGELTCYLFEEFVEHHLIAPHHIIDHPIESTPLCKLHRDPKLKEQGLVERFESFILGFEFCNSYTELNDPILQRKLLEEQASKRHPSDIPAPPIDEEFIEAICQGLPPTAGLGMGIDRLIMLLTGANSIRDVLYFPLMKPEEY